MDAIDLIGHRPPKRRRKTAAEPPTPTAQLSLLTDALEPTLHACDCPRHATCPSCDPDYVEQDGDWANGIVTWENCGLLKDKSGYNRIPF